MDPPPDAHHGRPPRREEGGAGVGRALPDLDGHPDRHGHRTGGPGRRRGEVLGGEPPPEGLRPGLRRPRGEGTVEGEVEDQGPRGEQRAEGGTGAEGDVAAGAVRGRFGGGSGFLGRVAGPARSVDGGSEIGRPVVAVGGRFVHLAEQVEGEVAGGAGGGHQAGAGPQFVVAGGAGGAGAGAGVEGVVEGHGQGGRVALVEDHPPEGGRQHRRGGGGGLGRAGARGGRLRGAARAEEEERKEEAAHGTILGLPGGGGREKDGRVTGGDGLRSAWVAPGAILTGRAGETTGWTILPGPEPAGAPALSWSGRGEEARAALGRALALSRQEPERRLLERRLRECGS